MGGLVLDIWVAFLVRSFANGFRRLRSRKWPAIKAIVSQSHVEPSGGFGCAVATISCDFQVGDEKYSATHDEPCMSRASAEYFARCYPRSKELIIRYDPSDPSRSVALI
jgi:hypothetical protein